MTERVHIRWLIRRDLEEVLEIERCVFHYPWLEEDFVRVLRGRNNIGLVAEDIRSDRIVGFTVYTLHKTRLDILNFAVARDLWRRGIGSQLWSKLAGKLTPTRRRKLTARVWERNLRAQLFLLAMGAECVGITPCAYEENDDAAYEFEYRVGSRVEAGR